MSKSKLIRLAACLIPAIVIWLLPLSIFGTEFVVTEQRMLAIFVMAALMWILEPVPAWVTSTFSILVMLLTVSTGGIGPLVEGIDEKHIVSYQSLLGSYADPIIILFLGGFVMALAASESGLANDVINAIPFSSLSAMGVIVTSGLICWVLSTFISNTAAAAMLMPIMVVVGTDIEHNLTDMSGVMVLLLGVGLAASYAMSLPISTPPNSIAYATGKVTTKQMAIVGVIVGIFSLALTYLLLFTVGEKIL